MKGMKRGSVLEEDGKIEERLVVVFLCVALHSVCHGPVSTVLI